MFQWFLFIYNAMHLHFVKAMMQAVCMPRYIFSFSCDMEFISINVQEVNEVNGMTKINLYTNDDCSKMSVP